MSGPKNHPPLSTLLSWTWIAHTIEVDNLLEADGARHLDRITRISLPMWANGLRLITEEGITVEELRRRARAACNLGGLERWGWIHVGDPTRQRRDGYGSHRGITPDTVLRPTRAGSWARRAWPRALGEVDSRWRSRFGTDVLDGVCTAVAAPAVPLPWAPPELAPPDGFRTRVIGGDTAGSERPFGIRLGQTLTRLTLEHEKESLVSLPIGADVLRVIDSGVIRIRDLPAAAGISKEAIAMAISYLQRTELAERSPERTVSLTPAGLDALADYRSRAGMPENAELRDALTAVVERPKELAAGLEPPEGCWRGERPYLTQTRRVLADPTAALPWQPMVLHRAGWPDGS